MQEGLVRWCVWVPAAGSFDCNPAACFVVISSSAGASSVSHMCCVCGTTCLQRLTAARLALVVALTCAPHMEMLVRCVDQQERPVQWCMWMSAAGSFDCFPAALFAVASQLPELSSTRPRHVRGPSLSMPLAAARLRPCSGANMCAAHGNACQVCGAGEGSRTGCMWMSAAGRFDCFPAALFAVASQLPELSSTRPRHVRGPSLSMPLAAARLRPCGGANMCAAHGNACQVCGAGEGSHTGCMWMPAAGSLDCITTACTVVLSSSAGASCSPSCAMCA
jgi:hypothetical protein